MILITIFLAAVSLFALMIYAALHRERRDAREILLRCPRCGMMGLESPERGVPGKHGCFKRRAT